MMTNTAQTRGDGTFQLVGLAPGAYTLTTRSMMNPAALEAGQARITVGSDDLDNVLITISAGAVASGVVRTDDDHRCRRAQLIRVMATPPDPMSEPMMMGGVPRRSTPTERSR